ncbi:hypothetical protein MLD63_07790 [Paracoccus sp. TK19116]|uniref:Uncharacterized protein n=1 Tax=Paracoccus albicereus TaxID=2922394 RepID=A0ABT1MSJ9_9RHOB|nr:hypothetical protein [Paracoccus albicereus]MCQ0970323.1 hypothetical protein [Paracoccus albicereus]
MTWQALFDNDRIVAAFVTAIVGGSVVALGWIITHLLSRHRDRVLREERIGDIQRALLAEIRAHVAVLELQGPEPRMLDMDRVGDADYLPILPHDANDRIFRAIVEQVHMLPQWAIDPVVRYYRLIAVRAALAQDIRSTTKDYPKRAAQMFRDYLGINEEAKETGLEAVEILTASVRGGPSLKGSRREVERVLDERAREMGMFLSASLPDQLAELRTGLNMRSSDRSDL